VILSIPALATARVFVHVANTGEITSGSSLGNLLQPLSKLQLLGIWPVGDFRLRPSDIHVTYVLIGALAVSAAVGLFAAVKKRSAGVPLYVVVAMGGCFFVIGLHALGNGSPWLDGKALATASPALVVAGVAGVAWMLDSGRLVEGLVALALIATGVLWSNALAYGNVWLAPRSQLAELESIGKRFAGDGPTLMTEYQPYGVRHFLRKLDPEGASERRARFDFLRDGSTLDKGQYADLDAFALPDLLVYRTIVLRTSPLESRPPSAYRLVSRGRYYEVWQQPEQPPTILDHLSLGTDQQPVGVASCSDVNRLSALAAQKGGTLVAAERVPAQTIDLTAAQLSGDLQPASGGALYPTGRGTATEGFSTQSGGVYGFWLAGSSRDDVHLSVDGKPVGSAAGELEEAAQLMPVGEMRLTAGKHRLKLSYSGTGLRPGSRGPQFAFGPVEVGRSAADSRLVDVPPAAAASLCRNSYDWIEAVAGR
jgi:hypothetical protein